MGLEINELYICCSPKTKDSEEVLLNSIEDKLDNKLVDFLDYDGEGEFIVLVIGGDGTLNYFLNNTKYLNRAKVLYIPRGTANDFAKSLYGQSMKLELTNEHIVDIINYAPFVEVPVMQCNDQKFVNVATAGAPAMVTDSGNSLIKEYGGRLSYFISAIEKVMTSYLYDIKVCHEDTCKDYKCYGFFVSQGLYAGGGVRTSLSQVPMFGKDFSLTFKEDDSVLGSISSVIKIQNMNSREELLKDESEINFSMHEKVIISSSKSIDVKLDGEEYKSKELEFSKTKDQIKFYIFNF